MKPVSIVISLLLLVSTYATLHCQPNFWVVGYFSRGMHVPSNGSYPNPMDYYKDNLMPKDIDWSAITHVVHGIVPVIKLGTDNFSLDVPGEVTPGQADLEYTNYISDIVGQAHLHQVPVLLSVGGWNNTAFAEALLTPGGRTTLLQSILNIINDNAHSHQVRYEGVDIDFETSSETWTPGGAHKGGIRSSDISGYMTFVQSLHSALHTPSLFTPGLNGQTPLLTTAIKNYDGLERQAVSEMMNPGLPGGRQYDKIFIMTYDFYTPDFATPGSRDFTCGKLWHNSNLDNSTPIKDYDHDVCAEKTTDYNSGKSEMASWISYSSGAIPLQYLCLGLSFYGYDFYGGAMYNKGGHGARNPEEIWNTTLYPTTQNPLCIQNVPYYNIMDNYYSHGTRTWRSGEQAPYLSLNSGTKDTYDHFVPYEDEAVLPLKMYYAATYAPEPLGGVFIWELGGGYRRSQSTGSKDLLLQAVKNTKANIVGGQGVVLTFSANFTIPAGTTYVILPGTTVKFASGTSLTSYGRLVARGTSSSRITFTSVSGTWGGITIGGAYASNSVLEYATISNVQTYGGTAVSVSNAAGVTIRYCKISNNFNYGTTALYFSNAGSPEVGYNQIGGNGAGVSFYNTNGAFYKNFITDNAVGCSYYSSPMFGKYGVPAYSGGGNNTIRGTNLGATFSASSYSSPFLGSYGNSYYYGYDELNNSPQPIRVTASTYAYVQAEFNWWGTVLPAIPTSSMFQTTGGAQIIWTNYLTSDPTTDPAPFTRMIAAGGTLPRREGGPLPELHALSPSSSVVTSAPDPVETSLQTALDKRVQGDYVGAASALKTALTLPSLSPAQTIRTAVQFLNICRESRGDGLLSDALSLLSSNPLPQVQGVVAELLVQNGQTDQAASLLQKLAASNPGTETEKLSLLRLAYLYLDQGNLPSAGAIIIPLQKANPGDAGIRQCAWLLNTAEQHLPFLQKQALSTLNIPSTYTLSQNYPNPFNPQTTIEYALKEDRHVHLFLYNLLGQEIVRLVDQDQQAGYKTARFNANRLASGIYFYRLSAGSYTNVKKMLLMK